MKIVFEWDETKAVTNIKKHKISFELAVRAFADPFALTKPDRFENGEQRWQTIGVVDGFLILLVAHTVRDEEDQEIVRIISARRAEPKERKEYEQNRSL
jgi:uncharacterized DUF497 family protein